MTQSLPTGTEALLERMDRLVALMEQDGHTFWNVRVREAATHLRQGNRHGFQMFLSGFGTSGSFNEAAVGKGAWIEDKFEWEPGQKTIHEEFERLKSEAYDQARQLQRDSEPPLSSTLATSYAGASKRLRLLLWALAVFLLVFLAYAAVR